MFKQVQDWYLQIIHNKLFSAENDIVILKLSRDAVFNDYVQPACLPSSSSSTYFGQSAIVSGYIGRQ